MLSLICGIWKKDMKVEAEFLGKRSRVRWMREGG
jgi:hypothetical protein